MTNVFEFARRYGGWFDPDLDLGIVHQRLSNIVNEINRDIDLITQEFAERSNKGVNLKFGFLMGDIPSAHVESLGEIDCIGIELGYYFYIREIFGRVLENGGVLLTPEGDVSQDEKCPWSDRIDVAKLMGNGDRFVSKVGMIKMLDFLVFHACRLVFHHELGHLWNGHADFNLSAARELQDLNSALVNQAFELDADAKAAHATIRLSPILTMIEESAFFPSIDPDGGTFEMRVYHMACTIYLAQRMLIHLEQSGVAKSSSKYPDPVHRMMWVMEILLTRWAGDTNQVDLKVFQLIYTAVRRCEESFCAVTSAAPINIFDARELEEATAKRIELLKIWARLLPHLEATKRGIIVPQIKGALDGTGISRLSIFGLIDAPPLEMPELFSFTPEYMALRTTQPKCLQHYPLVFTEEQRKRLTAVVAKLEIITNPEIWRTDHIGKCENWHRVLLQARELFELIVELNKEDANKTGCLHILMVVFHDPVLNYIQAASKFRDWKADEHLSERPLAQFPVLGVVSRLRNVKMAEGWAIIEFAIPLRNPGDDIADPQLAAWLFHRFAAALQFLHDPEAA